MIGNLVVILDYKVDSMSKESEFGFLFLWGVILVLDCFGLYKKKNVFLVNLSYCYFGFDVICS